MQSILGQVEHCSPLSKLVILQHYFNTAALNFTKPLKPKHHSMSAGLDLVRKSYLTMSVIVLVTVGPRSTCVCDVKVTEMLNYSEVQARRV